MVTPNVPLQGRQGHHPAQNCKCLATVIQVEIPEIEPRNLYIQSIWSTTQWGCWSSSDACRRSQSSSWQLQTRNVPSLKSWQTTANCCLFWHCDWKDLAPYNMVSYVRKVKRGKVKCKESILFLPHKLSCEFVALGSASKTPRQLDHVAAHTAINTLCDVCSGRHNFRLHMNEMNQDDLMASGRILPRT